jgi:hypothetical protein
MPANTPELIGRAAVRQTTARSAERNGARLSGDRPPAIRHEPDAARQRQRDAAKGMKKMTIYQLTDRLHGRTVRVHADHIAGTVASWLAELDAWTPLVELLGRAVRDGDWPAIHAIADYLSVEVQVAA